MAMVSALLSITTDSCEESIEKHAKTFYSCCNIPLCPLLHIIKALNDKTS